MSKFCADGLMDRGDTVRMQRISNIIKKIQQLEPDWRIGQIIGNALNGIDPFYVEDHHLEQYLQRFYEAMSQQTSCYEKILCASCIFTVKEGGQERQITLYGKRHADCIEQLSHLYPQSAVLKDKTLEGFWTSFNRFVDRYDGMKLALQTGQLQRPTGTAALYSEDLW